MVTFVSVVKSGQSQVFLAFRLSTVLDINSIEKEAALSSIGSNPLPRSSNYVLLELGILIRFYG
jgi:hypothetical protein